jgi:hypothetical protein
MKKNGLKKSNSSFLAPFLFHFEQMIIATFWHNCHTFLYRDKKPPAIQVGGFYLSINMVM